MIRDEQLNQDVLKQQQSAQQADKEKSQAYFNMIKDKKDIPIIQGQLTLDDTTIEILSKYYQGDRLNMIKRQMNAILGLINVNVNRYNYSKDYKDAVDYMIALITAGKLL